MLIDWDDRDKCKTFRLALEQVYFDYDELDRFVAEELGENLATISEKNKMSTVTFRLLKEAKAKGWLDEVFEAFCRENPDHRVIAELQQRPLIKKSSNLGEKDWESLFEYFFPYDFADIQRAFLRGFRQALGADFHQVRPDHPLLNEQAQIQQLLATFDNPKLAVSFVENVIVELQRSSEGNDRDLTFLEQWRDRISQQYNVSPKPSEPVTTTARHAYLLVALEEIGPDVNVYPELHVTGVEKSIRFGATPTTCSVDKVADQISEWIHQAEDALNADICDDEEVILEVFLPCRHLEEDIATTWSVKDKRGDEITLGSHRWFLVRSSDRIRDRQIQWALKRRWAELEACARAKNACDKFHLQEICPQEKGGLRSLLKDNDAPGLKLVAQLPTDSGRRIDLLNDIIDAAVPIVLWSSEVVDAATLKTEFDILLKSCHLTNFADLARQWRIQRRDAAHIKLLCDRPDRFPRLPDLKNQEDTDAIVA